MIVIVSIQRPLLPKALAFVTEYSLAIVRGALNGTHNKVVAFERPGNPAGFVLPIEKLIRIGMMIGEASH